MAEQMKIVLASGSPRRRELLKGMGLDFEILVSDAEEIKTGLPSDQVRTNARLKAEATAKKCTNSLVIAADTLVSLNDRALGKPASKEDAVRMLHDLSGRAHQVFTGVCVLNTRTGAVTEYTCRSDVIFRDLTDSEIETYVATGEPMDKAGAYAIQGGAAKFVERYEGSYTNIISLAVDELKNILDQVRSVE